MSLYGAMRTGVSGMNAQSSRLGTIADNIANANTTGYKKADTEFSSLVMTRPNNSGTYNSGGVLTNVRHHNSQQGSLNFTASATDLAVQGQGFFVVQSPAGQQVLTRAGSFVPDAQGRLVNAAGYILMGQEIGTNTGSGGALVPIDLASNQLQAQSSVSGKLSTNVDSESAIVAAADLPSANAATADFSAKTSLVAYGNLGGEVILDFYFTKTAGNTFEVAVFDRAQAAAAGGFPYASGPLSTQTLTFDPLNGQLDAASATQVTVPVPGGQSLVIDVSDTTQLSSDFSVQELYVDGNAPSNIARVQIDDDGTLVVNYESGATRSLYSIPLASVASPDRLLHLPGNVYAQSPDSGLIRINTAQTGGMGSIVSGALEASNVDIAEELTEMISSQRGFTANSKVFQTGSELLDVIVNLKR